MNEITDKLIRDLAEKLGTTSEHLWSVLVRQAPISGITNLFVMAVWIILLLWAVNGLHFGDDIVPPQLTNNIVACPWCGKQMGCRGFKPNAELSECGDENQKPL